MGASRGAVPDFGDLRVGGLVGSVCVVARGRRGEGGRKKEEVCELACKEVGGVIQQTRGVVLKR